MIKIDSYQAILFDFGNTLADEFYFKKGNSHCPDLPEFFKKEIYDPYYADPDGNNLLNEWMLGNISAKEIAKTIANASGVDQNHILELMHDNCRALDIFQGVLSFARKISREKKMAIVTVNADIFNETITPFYELDNIFDVIVNSCDIQSLSKNEICLHALKKLGVDIQKSLLIDNTLRWCEEFKKIGGNSYHFLSELNFIRDFAHNSD